MRWIVLGFLAVWTVGPPIAGCAPETESLVATKAPADEPANEAVPEIEPTVVVDDRELLRPPITPAEESENPTEESPPATPEPPDTPDAPVVIDEPPPTSGGTFSECLAWAQPDGLLVDYDAFGPTVGAHCAGTAHQKIEGVERVVFVGDSITVGSPPTESTDWYRNVLAMDLAERFDLEPPSWFWSNVDVISGVSMERHSGDFSTCAKWGARTDDLLLPPHEQLVTCNPEELRDKRTLVVMTMGGNDLFSWAQDVAAGVPLDTIWGEVDKAIVDFENAIAWTVAEETFPNGVFVVFGNTFEFTDADSANDLASCPGAALIGMNVTLIDPEFSAMASHMMAEYMRIAVEYGVDMALLGEEFCGHGYMSDQPDGRCYRGPETPLWLDFTCMHPSGAGHHGIAQLFRTVIDG